MRANSAGLLLPASVPQSGTGLTTIPAGSFVGAGATSTDNMNPVASNAAGSILISQGNSAYPVSTAPNLVGCQKLIASTTISTPTSTVTFTGLSSTYFVYKLRIFDVKPESGTPAFLVRISSNNGSTYDAGASDYQYFSGIFLETSPGGLYTNGATTGMRLDYQSVDPTNGGANYFELTFVNPTLSQANPGMFFKGRYYDVGQTSNVYIFGHGRRATTTNINALLVRFGSSINIATGTFKLYGILA